MDELAERCSPSKYPKLTFMKTEARSAVTKHLRGKPSRCRLGLLCSVARSVRPNVDVKGNFRHPGNLQIAFLQYIPALSYRLRRRLKLFFEKKVQLINPYSLNLTVYLQTSLCTAARKTWISEREASKRCDSCIRYIKLLKLYQHTVLPLLNPFSCAVKYSQLNSDCRGKPLAGKSE